VNWVNYVIVEINGIYGYLDIRETSTNVNVNINNNKFDSRLIF
jgi:hypothetical protein